MKLYVFYSDCVDSDAQCPEWASQGECEFNPIWMKENCRLSCNTCETDPTAKPPVTNPPEGRVQWVNGWFGCSELMRYFIYECLTYCRLVIICCQAILVHVMARHLFGLKPLSETIMPVYQLGPQERILVTFTSKTPIFILENA